MKFAFRSYICKVRTSALTALALLAVSCYTLTPIAAYAASDQNPIRIGVIAPQSTSVGKGIVDGVKLAASEINASGGVNGRPIKLFTYGDQLSASVAVRDFQRLVQQKKVVAVVGVWLSEIALALEPWASRLKTPLIIADSGSPKITEQVHNHYAKYKYIFMMLGNSVSEAHTICNFTRHTLAPKLGAKKAVILSENAKWTKSLDKAYAKCLPKAGVKVVDHIRFSPDTQDFTPIFNRIESHNPGLIVTGLAHTGLQTTVQWAQNKVPALMVGMNAPAISQGFWKQSNGAASGVITLSGPELGVALTPKTQPYMKAFIKRFGHTVAPSYGVAAYDGLHILGKAIERAGTTDADPVVKSLEQTDYVGAGTADPIRFLGRKDRFTHQSTYHWTIFQWQNGKRVPVWPPKIAKPVKLPNFVHLDKTSGSR